MLVAIVTCSARVDRERRYAAQPAASAAPASIANGAGSGTAATPPAIVNKLSAELAKIVKMPDVYAKVADDGTIMIGSTPEQLGKYITDEAARWRRVVADTGIKLAE